MATLSIKPPEPTETTFILELNQEEVDALATCLDAQSAAGARKHGFNYHAIVNVSAALNEGWF